MDELARRKAVCRIEALLSDHVEGVALHHETEDRSQASPTASDGEASALSTGSNAGSRLPTTTEDECLEAPCSANDEPSQENWQEMSRGGKRPAGDAAIFVVRPLRPKQRPVVRPRKQGDPETERAVSLSEQREGRREAALERLRRRRDAREQQKRKHRAARKRKLEMRRMHAQPLVTAQSVEVTGKGCDAVSSGSESVSGGDDSELEDEPRGLEAVVKDMPVGRSPSSSDEGSVASRNVVGIGLDHATEPDAAEPAVAEPLQDPQLGALLKDDSGSDELESCLTDEAVSLQASRDVDAVTPPATDSSPDDIRSVQGVRLETPSQVDWLQETKGGAQNRTEQASHISPAHADAEAEPLKVQQTEKAQEPPDSGSTELIMTTPCRARKISTQPSTMPGTTGTAFSNVAVSAKAQDYRVDTEDVRLALDDPQVDYAKTFPNLAAILSRCNDRPFTMIRRARGDCGSMQKYTGSVTKGFQHLLQLYTQWQQVIRDYSTVFQRTSDNRCDDCIGHPNVEKAKHFMGGAALFYRVVASSKPEVYNIVSDVLAGMSGWDELPADLGLKTTWNLLWTWSKPRINYDSLLVFQRVNHFPNSRELTRKDLLKRHLNRLVALERGTESTRQVVSPERGDSARSSRGSQSFNVMPQTFTLPQEYTEFVSAYMEGARSSVDSRSIWIVKPVSSSRGRGIQLIDDICKLSYGEVVVVQRYITNPYLIDSYKFDLRLYVLVTSFQPLEAFIYTEGFARISTEQYNLQDINNRMVHLTNSSVQKFNAKGPSADSPLRTAPENQTGGTKVTLSYIWSRLLDRGVDVDVLWRSIIVVVLKSLACVEDSIPFQPNCFELFGYDVLIDQHLRPWLLEVNASPSMARENQLDRQLKERLIRDTILLVDPLPYDRNAVVDVLRRTLGKGNDYDHQGCNASTFQLDLKALLRGRRPRLYGEMPAHMGNYERICPHTATYRDVLRLKRKVVRDNC